MEKFLNFISEHTFIITCVSLVLYLVLLIIEKARSGKND